MSTFDPDALECLAAIVEEGGFERAEFAVVILMIAGHVDHRHGAVEGLRGPARARCMIMDVAGQHDQIRLRMRDQLGLIVFQMQIGQHSNLHDDDSYNGPRTNGDGCKL